MQGRGTYRYDDGGLYEGEWAGGEKAGRGTYHATDGQAYVGGWRAGEPAGDGVRWSTDRQQAWHLRDGDIVAPMDLEEARQTSIDMAVTMPEPAYHATGGAAAAAAPLDPRAAPDTVRR